MMTTTTILRATIPTAHPLQQALAFQTLLALEKGFSSTIDVQEGGVTVTASDGQAIRFVVLADGGLS